MKILVLGGAGYIGSHTVYGLIDAGEEVVIIDNLETGHIEAVHPQAKFYKGDLRDKERDREGMLRPRLWPLPECFPDGRGTGRLAGQFSHCMGPVHRKAVRIHGLYR